MNHSIARRPSQRTSTVAVSTASTDGSQTASRRVVRYPLAVIVLAAMTLTGCVSGGAVARPPTGTGQSGGNGNVPTYTP